MVFRHRDLCDLILYDLYLAAAEPNGVDEIAPNDLYSLAFENITSSKFYDAAIETLSNRELIEKAGLLPDTMAITNKGISYVDRELDDVNSFLSLEIQTNGERGRSRIPATDRFVELDHNSQPYKDAISTGEELIEAVRTSNAYPGADNSDKQQRLAELEAGYRLLRSPRVNSTNAKIVLGSVLTYLVTKFADEPIGQLAKLAWAALKALLGF